MLRSMTGFASATGALAPHSWTWELRAVNGKGQDLRLRVPDWIDGLEVMLRKKLTAATARGNVTLSLRVSREEAAAAVQVNPQQLESALDALVAIEAAAMAKGIGLSPSKVSDLMGLRGILDVAATSDDTTALLAQLGEEADALIAAFDEMRKNEGGALEAVLLAQLVETETLTSQAVSCLEGRAEEAAATLRRNLSRVVENTDGLDEARIAQELALLAVKSDVTEELDRLSAHIAAARALIAEGGTVGRKLDFLMQEFNREANTLCSKSQYEPLTRVGLALKAVIDQMREQVQNVE